MAFRYLLLCLLALSCVAEAKIPRSQASVAEFKRQNPCPSTGLRRGKCPGYQVDHIIPLKCAGPDRPENMQWLSVQEHKLKTKREIRSCPNRRG